MDPWASTITWCRSHQDPIPASSSASSTVLESLHNADESFCMLFPMLLDQADTFIDGDRWTTKISKSSRRGICAESEHGIHGSCFTWSSLPPIARPAIRWPLSVSFGPSGKSLPLISPDSVLLFDWNFGKLLHLELKVGVQNFSLKL